MLLKNALKKQVKQNNEAEQQNNIYEIRQSLKRENKIKQENVKQSIPKVQKETESQKVTNKQMFTPNQFETPMTANVVLKSDHEKIQVQEFQQVIPPKIIVTEKDFLPLQQLGRGSFGDVYLVKDLFPNSGKLYAMKVLNKRSKSEESWLRYI